MITMECVIPQRQHRTVMGAKGYKVQEITRDCDVGIKFPDRPVETEGEISHCQIYMAGLGLF